MICKFPVLLKKYLLSQDSYLLLFLNTFIFRYFLHLNVLKLILLEHLLFVRPWALHWDGKTDTVHALMEIIVAESGNK